MPKDNQKHHICGRSSGFTLIEVMIAMAIFAIGILAVASLQLWNVKNNSTGNFTTLATLLARAQMEQLKNVSDVTTLASGSDPNNPIDANGNAGGLFTRSWVVTNPLTGNATRQIQVTVSWTKGGRSRSIVLTSITRGNGT